MLVAINVGRNVSLTARGQERRSLLRVDIKTSYSGEVFIIPDWQSDVHADFYGRRFFDVESYADFYLRGELCFCDEFEILEIKRADQEEIREYCQASEINQEEFVSGGSVSITLQ